MGAQPHVIIGEAEMWLLLFRVSSSAERTSKETTGGHLCTLNGSAMLLRTWGRLLQNDHIVPGERSALFPLTSVRIELGYEKTLAGAFPSKEPLSPFPVPNSGHATLPMQTLSKAGSQFRCCKRAENFAPKPRKKTLSSIALNFPSVAFSHELYLGA
jgi:hypothetical protein